MSSPSAVSSNAQGYKNVTISATDPRITYSPQWDLGTSTCDASQQSKKTVTGNQSLSFNTQGVSGSGGGSSSAIYVDFSQQGASFQILIGGQSELNNVGVLQNCAPNGPVALNNTTTEDQIQILVNSLTSETADSFFEFNSFIITVKSSSVSNGTPYAQGVKVIGFLLLAVLLSV
jgi:hypothetical protein